jgi:hypothetical protein
LYHPALGFFEVKRFGGILGDENYVESAVLQHAVELAFTSAK